MATLSLLARNCGIATGGENRGFIEYGASSRSGNDFLFSSCLLKRVCEYQSKCVRVVRRGFFVVARAKKWKKHDYPWPDDLDPNITGGHLRYLSHFKPLTEKPKPVTLPFEKPLIDLEKKLIEVRRMADETGLDFSDQIGALEKKYQQALKDLYTHLTPIQRLAIARHPNRPTVLDHVFNITDKWVELHGDRAGYDDPAIVTGIGTLNGKSYMFIGHQKGRNTKENIARNFAMPTPHGYRKALRMMKYADHHGFPIVTFVDTPGAFADLKSEELGQGEAIAHNLRAMFGFKVPIVTVVTGEGGSGGALAIACCNKLFMLENSAFYVASPEACAAILWKSSQAAPKAAEKLRITAQEHYRLKIADGIIPEPLGGAHADPAWISHQIKLVIIQAMEELTSMDKEELLRHRMLKFRQIGGFQEGVPVEPERKQKMKPSDVNKPNVSDIEIEIENFKKKVLEFQKPLAEPVSAQALEKLKQDLDREINNAFISMGLQEKIESIKLELHKSPNNQPLSRSLKEKVDNIMSEFKYNLSRPGAYLGLKQKLEKLNKVARIVELKEKSEKLKAEINQKITDELKTKMKLLKVAEEKLSKGDPLDKDLSEEVEKARTDLVAALKSAGLEVVGVSGRNEATTPPPSGLPEKLLEFKKHITEEIERVIGAAGLRSKIQELKTEMSKRSSSGKLEAEIKEQVLAELEATKLQEEFENLTKESRTSSELNQGEVGAENVRLSKER
ncbi:hypothetical protein K2173_013500 [Erythroxylum novogranatense]|uniref:acetyl-CoA carboxytransferase n=1 Tax=Erythroxylum novogranatense TaxID=1862640 RepID=A0AAV8SAM6_9ROSI|nr:hypothetical protein K2173_013500 [Erythroxylum novogranatense]